MGLSFIIRIMNRILALAAASLFALSLSGCADQTPTTQLYTCVNYSVEPTEFTPYCADAGQVFSDIAWSNWGKDTATGTATATTNLCDPDCVSGNFVLNDVTLVLSKPMQYEGKTVFSELSVDYAEPITEREDPETLSLVLGPIG